MNYRHAFHAGNFADVVKHAVLTRILVYLRSKPAAFRVIDTHAGAGLYDLAGQQASRSPEWREGIARLLAATLGEASRALLAPYLTLVARFNPAGRLIAYPGSPAIVRELLRPQDRLVACELEPNAAAALMRNFAGHRASKIVAIDGWTALKAYVPPKERRGMVLIDPPFEEESELTRLLRGLEAAHRKWPSGTYLLWYPIKAATTSDALALALRRTGIAKILRAELRIAVATALSRLRACGVIVVNPPWTLERELKIMLPELAAILSGDASGSWRLDWLAREK
jgi:23S rRNA (adenine2030-N6)-methyltransferase